MVKGIGRAAAAAALVIGLVSPVARADQPSSAATPSDAVESRLVDLLRQGREAAKSHRVEACIEAYQAAMRLVPSAKTAGELGLCEESLGRYDRAHRHLSLAIDGAPAPVKGGTLHEPWSRFRAALERVSDRVARVIVLVDPASAEVFVDGESLGVQKSGHFVAVLPGPHTWIAKLDGYDDATVTHTVASGDFPDVALTLHKRPAPSPLPPPPAAAATAAPSASAPPVRPWYLPATSPRGIAIGFTYAGLAVVVLGGVTTLALEADRAPVAAALAARYGPSACAPDPKPADCTRLRTETDARVITRTVTAAGAGLTGAAALAAVLLTVFPPALSSPRAAMVPVATPHGGGFIVTGAW